MEELFLKNYFQKKRKKGRAGIGRSLRKRGRKTKEKTMGWKCSSKGKGHDRERSLDRAGYQEGNGEKANTAIIPVSQIFHTNSTTTKLKAACITAFF